MLRPSYSELMEVLNDDIDLNSQITSRYTIVIAVAKRAKQIINGGKFDAAGVSTDKAVSIAVSEMEKGEIKIFPDGLSEDMNDDYVDPDEVYSKKIAETLNAPLVGDFDEEVDLDDLEDMGDVELLDDADLEYDVDIDESDFILPDEDEKQNN